MDPDAELRLNELMRRAQDGDRQAYEAFLTTALTLVRVFVRGRLRQPDHVEDIVQDTLLAIHHHRHTYDPERPVRPWIYGIARHRLIDFVAKQRRRATREIFAEVEAEAPVSAALMAHAGGFAELVSQALALLPGSQREVIELLKLDGYSVAEIADKTGRSEASVKVTAHRGYKALRKLLEGTYREK